MFGNGLGFFVTVVLTGLGVRFGKILGRRILQRWIDIIGVHPWMTCQLFQSRTFVLVLVLILL